MELTNQQALPVTQAQAWEALNDIELLKAAIPGCESITPSADQQYDVVVMAAVGPVKARFKGKLRLTDLDPPNAYTIHFEGQGGPAGHGKGSAQVRLESTGPNATTLHYTARATVGGKIAQIGSRLVDMAAQKMATEFFETFNARLTERYGAAPQPLPQAAEAAQPAPATGLLARLLAWLKKVFG